MIDVTSPDGIGAGSGLLYPVQQFPPTKESAMKFRSMLHRSSRATASHRGATSLEQALARATSTTQRDELLYLKSTRR